MNQSFDVSTIIFAALAIFIIWKLRQVLGTRTGEERPPSNPFARRTRAETPANDTGNVISLPGAAPGPIRTAEPDPNRWKGVAEPGSPAIAGLDAIAAADPSFTGQSFVGGARGAYEMIIAAYAKGDRETLSGLLAKDVFDGFVAAIAEREARGDSVDHTMVAMDRTLVRDAQLRDRTAQVTVEFDTQQINATRTRDGKTVEDGTEKVSHVIDTWVFARDTRSRNPNWQLVATNAE